MKKRLVSMLLALVMVLGMLPVTALAASSEEEALGEVNIYNGEQKLSYLSINGRIRELIYTYFNYVDSQRQDKGDSRVLRQPEYLRRPADGRPRREHQIHRQGKGQRSEGHGYHRQRIPYTRPFGAEAGEQVPRLLCDQDGAVVLPAPQLEHQQPEGQSQPDRCGASAGAGYPCRRQGHLCARHGVEQDLLAPCYRCS